MKKLILGLMVVGLVGVMVGTGEAATDPAKIDLYVTPIVATSLTVNPTYYNFGSVAVGVSTGSTSALTITNNGSIDVTIEKEVNADDDWDITLSSTTKDGFILWAMVSDNQPNHAAFVTGESSFSIAGLNQLNDLTDTTATQVSMSKDETNNLWFRLDMPDSSSTGTEKKLQIRLKATSQ